MNGYVTSSMLALLLDGGRLGGGGPSAVAAVVGGWNRGAEGISREIIVSRFAFGFLTWRFTGGLVIGGRQRAEGVSRTADLVWHGDVLVIP